MWVSTKRFHSRVPSSEPAVTYVDDGGSGLLKACEARFTPPTYEVVCDARHTVWVKRVDLGLSIGLSAWQLRGRSTAEILDSVAEKLGHATAPC